MGQALQLDNFAQIRELVTAGLDENEITPQFLQLMQLLIAGDTELQDAINGFAAALGST